ncbi:hypothetical protein TWF506_003740 [Arthrobotrys conoides]|uniref:F-box domain-containing protein n=1 Tax=Arthrobotrys conoides TaxID=74498 RepID=A0AAN8MXZ2_9PEZI
MEQLPIIQLNESACSADITNDEIASRAGQGITTLPFEIQSEILCHISTISDQISISETCKLWRTIIWEHKSCQKRRYTLVSDEVGLHKLINYDRPSIKWFSCIFQDGVVKKYRYKQYEDPETAERWKWRDLTSFAFLDDPVVSPFCEVPEFFNGKRGDEGPKISFMNRIYRWPPSALFLGVESWEFSTQPFFEPGEAPNASSGDHNNSDSNKEEWQSIRVSLEFSKWPSSLGVFYRTFAFVSAKTTMREFIQSIVEEIQPAMRRWELDTEMERELVFSSIRDINSEFEEVEGNHIDIYMELKCEVLFTPGKDKSWVENNR